MDFTMNHKIAHSNCQGEIEDDFWKIIKKSLINISLTTKQMMTKSEKPTNPQQDSMENLIESQHVHSFLGKMGTLQYFSKYVQI